MTATTAMSSRSSMTAEVDIDEVEVEEDQSEDAGEAFLPSVENDFWTFVHDRQRVWHARFREKQPRPWTSDPVLHENRFANIYRELDPGTTFAINQILELDEAPSDVLFNIVMYRVMASNKETASHIGFIRCDDFSAEELGERLLAYRDAGSTVFGAAYRVASCSQYGNPDHLTNVMRLLEDLAWDVPRLWRRVSRSSDPASWYRDFRKMPGCGPFLAHQCLVDISYPLHRLGGASLLSAPYSDLFVQAGPGARAGLKRLSGSRNSAPGKIRRLQSAQSEAFERLDLDFMSMAPTYAELYPHLSGGDFDQLQHAASDVPDINLANIEGCLCEFSKYASIKDGTGRGKRKYGDHLRVVGGRVLQGRQMPCRECGTQTTYKDRVAITIPDSVWPIIFCIGCALDSRVGDLVGK